MFCGGLQSQVSARLGVSTRLSHFLRQIPIPWEILIFPRLLISLHEESLSGLAPFLLLSLLLECHPLSLLRVPHISKTFPAIRLYVPCAAKAVTVRPPFTYQGSAVTSKPPATLKCSSSYSYSHHFTKPALLMLLCENAALKLCLWQPEIRMGPSHTTEMLLLLGFIVFFGVIYFRAEFLLQASPFKSKQELKVRQKEMSIENT